MGLSCLRNKATLTNVVTGVLLIILFIPNIATLLYSEDLAGFVVKQAGYLAVSLILLLLPAVFLKKKVYFIVEGILSLTFAPIEIASLYLSRTTTHFMMIDTILNTNWGEATELLLSVPSVVVAVVVLWGVYYWLLFRFIPNEKFFPRKVQRVFVIAIPITLLVGCIYFFRLTRLTNTSEKTTLLDNLVDMKDLIVIKFDKIYPFDVYLSTADVLKRNAEIRERQKRLSDFSFNISPKEDPMEETVVLVIGETARWKSFGLNGYGRNTTPLLSQDSNVVSYSHAVTLANLTSNSVPMILTRANSSNTELADMEKSVCEAFSEAGFSTSWVTAQEVTPFQERIMEACDNSFQQGKIITTERLYDMDLLPAIDSILGKGGHSNFMVVHTQGSHFRYNQRYPEQFDKYKPSFDKSMDFTSITSENVAYLVNAYDNSILYTDYFLSSLIGKLNARCPVWSMIYLSDHGENLYDDERNVVLHGSLVVTEYEAHIPFIVAYSDGYKAKYPEKVENMIANKDKNITSEVVFHSLLDMADIRAGVISDTLCIDQNTLKSQISTYILNGNRMPVFFEFSQLERERR